MAIKKGTTKKLVNNKLRAAASAFNINRRPSEMQRFE